MDYGAAALSDSNDASYSSGVYSTLTCVEAPSSSYSPDAAAAAEAAAEAQALRRLSDSLESIFELPRAGSGFSFSDATIVAADGREVPVHRCVLAVRSPFFGAKFSRSQSGVRLEFKELTEDFGVGVGVGFEVGAEALVVVLGYLYSGKVKAFPKGVCDCVDEECQHVACRPALEFLVQVLYASSRFQIPELVALYQRRLLDILDKVAPDDILLVLSAANICGDECHGLLTQCLEYVMRSDLDTVTLEKGLPCAIIERIISARLEVGVNIPERINFPDKHVKRIHRALDLDDVDLVRMLLKEGHTTLDDAHALHYAVAYCDAKTLTELLDLGIADVNCRNARGFTVLHVAAMRKEPNVIVSLLMKGAQPFDLSPDGRKALQLCKRCTKAADYMESTEEGKPSPNDKLCVEILEQAEQREPLLGEASFSLAVAGDDRRMELLYLENRVALARLLFPMEAKVAMAIAQVDGTREVPLSSRNCKDLAGSLRMHMDLDEAPFQEQHLKRSIALSRTVELGKRFFPRCSNVLSNIMDADDCTRLACLDNGTPEERLLKRRRFTELQEAFSKAFNEDKKELDKSNVSSFSSSSSSGATRPKGKLHINYRSVKLCE
ncbi:BTB/POZ domain and ankyrin repeat-containing protein NPR1 isoform X1 [Eucalyptus grandis]|uniref:BTB/POZ domain and ankyrin repeat-containing protein NPR1 isoform X1 n=2 Tax=Eucalyptus grandis TaxID=71139 RepID=UPI00192E7933|nr:BTB/POZ domain and ankyrin repeat-containing protein NPR1 isoform X1 [Eucalyptus grandis]